MRTYDKRLRTVEDEIITIRKDLDALVLLKNKHRYDKKFPGYIEPKLIELFGEWDGEIDSFLNELYKKRERRGRIE